MARVVVVGSGASAVHFAASALERGWRVTLVDVGREGPAPVRPDDSFAQLQERLEDPAGYFLGERFEGVLFPGSAGEYYGFPPHKAHLFAGLAQAPLRARGIRPLGSYAQGGLAQAWTGACFPFGPAELADFPLAPDALAPYYDLVAGRIGISGRDDDLARFVPLHAHLCEPLDLDEHSSELLAEYERHKGWLQARLGCWIGRSRAATVRADLPGRKGCTNLGRCLWGCPREALWTPSIALRELCRADGFEYVPGVFARSVALDGAGRARGVELERVDGGARELLAADRVVLGAGTLASARVVLETLRRAGGEAPRLEGLMDNRQVLVPFLNLRMLRRPYDPDTYQYHQIALGLEQPEAKHYVHGLVTTLKTAQIHPIVQSLPLDLRSALFVFRNVHAALGIVNVNFHDTRRAANALHVEPDPAGGPARLHASYEPAADEPARMKLALRRVKKALRRLGCVVPPGMTHVRPMGASVHYAGTLPMAAEGGPLTTTPRCELRAVPGLFLVDGSTFPFLPAKNLTFTLMANAARVADAAF